MRVYCLSCFVCSHKLIGIFAQNFSRGWTPIWVLLLHLLRFTRFTSNFETMRDYAVDVRSLGNAANHSITILVTSVRCNWTIHKTVSKLHNYDQISPWNRILSEKLTYPKSFKNLCIFY
jgi:hypothetical protein